MTRQQLLEIGQRLLDIHRELLQAAEDERQPGDDIAPVDYESQDG